MKKFLVPIEILKKYSSGDHTDLQKLSDLNRINCLAGLKEANHGWLGASFSSMEILTTIYNQFIDDVSKTLTDRPAVVLSKGHAAMAHYAVLAGKECFPVSDLLGYKQFGKLPAHSDRAVSGVDADSGSLGQGLSKGLGISVMNRSRNRNHPVFVLIGDGELQEGQLFESFLTWRKWGMYECIPIIDRNGLQSDSSTKDIKDAESWAKVFEGIGANVLEVDGHNVGEISSAVNSILKSRVPTVIISNTIKGAGTSLTQMSPETPRRCGIWHGAIPDDKQYLEVLSELVDRCNDEELSSLFSNYCSDFKPETVDGCPTAESEKNALQSTGQAFGESLKKLGHQASELYFLDADLEKSCRLTSLAEEFPDRFLEVGISEQDMCSIANGIGLNGGIAIVNTYASFFKRAIDQIYCCITEKVPVIFAGHYAGVDYFTDGKSHQSVNDIGLMRALGNIEVFEPISPEQSEKILEYIIGRMKNEVEASGKATPAYIRLHRTPLSEQLSNYDFFEPDTPIFYDSTENDSRENLLVTAGPHMLKTALDSQKTLMEQGISISIAAISHFSDRKNLIKKMLEKAKKVFTLESHRREGGLGSFISSIGFKSPVRIGVKHYLQSARDFKTMTLKHDLSCDTVCAVVKKVLSCEHNKKL